MSDTLHEFQKGDQVQVEVVSFGPLGASVEVIGLGHGANDVIEDSEPALGRGLILQKEIKYFREARNYVDVVVGEVLPAYIEKVRDDKKLHIALRVVGGKAKADQVSEMIMARLEWEQDGALPIGDKSPPEAIGREFPGVSKSAFKRALSMLYKKGLVKPGPDSISLMR
uniref:Conserved virulence factor B-like winged helix domain-containing protein n=1 Tax=Cyclophora tenuis TaxID=216820 RepID=A0A7S1D7J4_CYCTE